MSGFCSSGPRRRFSIASRIKKLPAKRARDTKKISLSTPRRGSPLFVYVQQRPIYTSEEREIAGPPATSAGGEQTHTASRPRRQQKQHKGLDFTIFVVQRVNLSYSLLKFGLSNLVYVYAREYCRYLSTRITFI